MGTYWDNQQTSIFGFVCQYRLPQSLLRFEYWQRTGTKGTMIEKRYSPVKRPEPFKG
jgi:hypothetical protein